MPKLLNTILSVLKATPAANPDANHIHIYGNATDELFQRNSAGVLTKITNNLVFFNSLAAAFPAVAQTNTTRVTVTGWTFPVTAGKTYKIQVLATFTTAAATTGASMGLITSAGAVGNIHGYFDADVTNTTVATGVKAVLATVNTVNTTANSFMTSTGTTLGQPASFTCNAIFNCTTGGSLNVQWGTEVGNSLAQMRLGSSLIVEVLN